VSDLTTSVCSITATRRRRFLWAAWWTGAPAEAPFRHPDASHGGARSVADALAEAERLTGRTLQLVEPYWARAWTCVLRGEPPPPRRTQRAPSPPAAPSAWSTLLLPVGASLDDVRRAYRARARDTHPDHGGDPAQFRLVQHAYERLTARLSRPRRRG
jgi:hypothetical protein